MHNFECNWKHFSGGSYTLPPILSCSRFKFQFSLFNTILLNTLYLLEASETSITIWRWEYPPKLLYLGCVMEKTAQWNFLKLCQKMYLDITIPWCKFKKILSMGKFRGYPGLHPWSHTVAQIDFFFYNKSCQYSMFYTNCSWNFS